MINLLPPETKQEIRFGQLNITAIQYAVLIILISLALVAVLFFGVTVVGGDERSLHQAIDEKQQILTELEPTVKEAESLEATINTISALLKREIQFSSLLQDIAGVIPEGASLTGLSLTGDETLPLRVDAVINDQSLAPVLRENLENSDLFEHADIQSIAASAVSEEGQATEYQVRIVVNFQASPAGGNQ